MKYMNFNSSCSYCCLANILEYYQVEIEDYQIALKMGLPYLIDYDKTKDCFAAGSMIQESSFYNLALNPLGFSLSESRLDKKMSLDYLKENKLVMVGLRLYKNIKHACVFMGIKDFKYVFLNPHRTNDGVSDYLHLSEDQLLDLLSDTNMIATIKKCDKLDHKFRNNFRKSLINLDSYRIRFDQFCSTVRTLDEIKGNEEPLLRVMALDLMEMMRLIGNESLEAKLKSLLGQVISLLRTTENIIPYQIIDPTLFREICDEYRLLILEQLK